MKGLVLDERGIRIGEGKDYYHSRVERLIFEAEGGILGYPDWGSRIPEFIMEPEDETSAQEMINETSFLFQNREDLLEISSMAVEIIPSNTGANGFAFQLGILLPEAADEDPEEIIKFYRVVDIS
jgi:hypothetical protein